MKTKVGIGYDVHRLASGRKLVLGGLEIDYEKGLDGHSDADVLIHSIMDALLGAAGLGDIGRHFPDNDQAYKNIDSKKLLKKVSKLIKKHGYRIGNIDAVIVAQEPKLSPFIEKMEKKIASVLGIKKKKINIKATTEEGLGFTGNKQAISAYCVCLLRSKK